MGRKNPAYYDPINNHVVTPLDTTNWDDSRKSDTSYLHAVSHDSPSAANVLCHHGDYEIF